MDSAGKGMAIPASRTAKPLFKPWVLLILPLLGSGCTVRRIVVSPPADASHDTGVHGLTSITILTSSKSASKDGEIFPPRPIGALQTPVYPENPLKAKYGQAVVAVRVFLDDSGRVTDIKDAPTCPSTGGRFAFEFRSAVEEAIHRWKFQPAEFRRYAEGKDLNGDGKPDYMVVIAAKPVPVYFDVRFDFSIVKGQGQVR